MKTFVFYEFKVVPDNQEPSLFQEEEDKIRSQFATPLDCFVKVLMSGPELHLPTCQPNHKQIPQNEYYRCDQLQHKDGVVLMTMENNKFKTTTVNKKDQKNPHHPFCQLLIDLRPHERMILGIERNAAFDRKTDKVVESLMDGFNKLMTPYHFRLEILDLVKKDKDFWPLVHELQKKFEDVVRSIRLYFNREQSHQSPAKSMLSFISNLARQANADGVLNLYSNEDDGVNIDAIYTDLTEIAKICLKDKAYDLEVEFKEFGVIRYGADRQAQFGVSDDVLTAFENGTNLLDFPDNPLRDIPTWLVSINDLLHDYKSKNIQKKRKRLH